MNKKVAESNQTSGNIRVIGGNANVRFDKE